MRKCENCGAKHDGGYGLGRFCSSKCARGFSTKAKRTEINQKVSSKMREKKSSEVKRAASDEYIVDRELIERAQKETDLIAQEMTANQKGDLAELKIMCRMRELGYRVAIPFDGSSPYDIIVDTTSKLWKVQCKYSRVSKDGTNIVVNSSYRVGPKQTRKSYTGKDIDYLATYCPETDKVYFIPAKVFKGKLSVTLKLLYEENDKVIRKAEDYIL